MTKPKTTWSPVSFLGRTVPRKKVTMSGLTVQRSEQNKSFAQLAQALKKPKEKICCAAFRTSQMVAPGEVES